MSVLTANKLGKSYKSRRVVDDAPAAAGY